MTEQRYAKEAKRKTTTESAAKRESTKNVIEDEKSALPKSSLEWCTYDKKEVHSKFYLWGSLIDMHTTKTIVEKPFKYDKITLKKPNENVTV